MNYATIFISFIEVQLSESLIDHFFVFVSIILIQCPIQSINYLDINFGL
jgi:hypothetical protein